MEWTTIETIHTHTFKCLTLLLVYKVVLLAATFLSHTVTVITCNAYRSSPFEYHNLYSPNMNLSWKFCMGKSKLNNFLIKNRSKMQNLCVSMAHDRGG